jgi:urease accessory protein
MPTACPGSDGSRVASPPVFVHQGSRVASPPVFVRGAGAGSLELTRVGSATAVTRARANSPLKLLAPRPRGSSAWVFASTYGGGLVAGDSIKLDATFGNGTIGLLSTQASTKIYRSENGASCRQTLNVRAAANSTCVIAPHPITCFARSRFIQRQRFDLHPTANLVLIDWLTSGRHATGERWAFDLYDSRTDIFVGEKHVFRDALRLTPEDGPIAAYHRTGGFDCLGYAVVIGERLQGDADAILQAIDHSPAPNGTEAATIFSASRITGGIMIRMAGRNSESVATWLRDRLAFVPPMLGERSWGRLW